jgi:flagellar hook-associated protein 2
MATSGISGLDVQSLVSQLMTIERQPIDKLNTKVTDTQSKISSFGTLKGLVSALQSELQSLKSSLEGYGATPADSTLLSASASSSAAAGTYTINVTKLAQAQNLVAGRIDSTTREIATSDATVSFTIGDDPIPKTVSIANHASLQDISDAINLAKIGVTATIINDGSGTPYRLVLTADKSGAKNGINSISVSGGGTELGTLLSFTAPTPGTPDPTPAELSASAVMLQSTAAQDAEFTMNGVAISSATNTVTGAIQGVTLTLKAKTTTPTTVTVARDTAAIDSAAAKFVESYNALITQLKSRSAYKTESSSAGVLSGDSAVRRMLEQLSSTLATATSGGTLQYLAEVGITTQAGGGLKLDTAKLNVALNSNYTDVVNLFNGTTGFATRLDAWATAVTQTGGLIDQRTQGLSDSIKRYNAQIDRLELQMTVLKKRYTTTYSNLNMLLSSMNDTSNYLTSQFG